MGSENFLWISTESPAMRLRCSSRWICHQLDLRGLVRMVDRQIDQRVVAADPLKEPGDRGQPRGFAHRAVERLARDAVFRQARAVRGQCLVVLLGDAVALPSQVLGAHFAIAPGLAHRALEHAAGVVDVERVGVEHQAAVAMGAGFILRDLVDLAVLELEHRGRPSGV